MGEYQKNFDHWNILKQVIHNTPREVYGHPREVWWCSLGVNIGSEADGKNESFERPVLIMRVYNKETLLALPITSKKQDNKFHFHVQVDSKDAKSGTSQKKDVWVKLTQARVVSNKRLLRKVDVIEESVFEEIKKAFLEFV